MRKRKLSISEMKVPLVHVTWFGIFVILHTEQSQSKNLFKLPAVITEYFPWQYIISLPPAYFSPKYRRIVFYLFCLDSLLKI